MRARPVSGPPRGGPGRWLRRGLGLALVLQALALIGCSGQAVVPPVDISSTSRAKQIPGHYAVTVQTGAWMLKSTTERAICGAWTFDTDLDASYATAIRNALKQVLERVTFVPELLSQRQLRERGFDAQIVVGQGGANSTFSVPVYAVSGTAHGNIELSVTVGIRPSTGSPTQETVSARGAGRAEISRCSGAATAIGASARNALGTVARGVIRSVQQRLDIRVAEQRQNRSKSAPPSTASTPDEVPAEEVETPTPAPEQRVADRSAESRGATSPPAAEDARDDQGETQVAVIPRAPSGATSRSRGDAGPLSAEQAFQRGIDAARGRGGRANDAEAVRWFRIAAEQGYAPAENNLGYMYAEGRGVSHDDRTAVQWYRRAADRGYPPAQTSLAMMIQAGRGVPRNDLMALALYSAASGQGYAPATANVGQMYAEGRGIPRDEDTAAFLLATAGESPRTGSGIFVSGE